MPCCMVNRNALGRPPEWLARKFVRLFMDAALDASAMEQGEVPGENYALTDRVVNLIASYYVGPDAARREGNLSFEKTHEKWLHLTRGGRHHMTQEDHQRDNAVVGSSFHCPIINVPCKKQNNGIMHTPGGHQNHYWKSINEAIKEKMKECDFQIRLSSIDGELEAKTKSNAKKIKDCNSADQMKNAQKNLRRKKKS